MQITFTKRKLSSIYNDPGGRFCMHTKPNTELTIWQANYYAVKLALTL